MTNTAAKKPSKILAWALLLGLLAIAGLGFWKLWTDIAQGHVLKVIVIGGMGIFGGWRAYKRARIAARS
jgi:hypothetical protein